MTAGEAHQEIVLIHHPRNLVREALVEVVRASGVNAIHTSDSQATLMAALITHQPTVVVLAVPSHAGYRRDANRTVETWAPNAAVIEIPRYLDHPHDETRLADIMHRLKSPGAIRQIATVVYARASDPCPLTAREIFVLNELASGLTSEQVATRMSLSKKTIDSYKSKIFKRLDVQSLLQAINKSRLQGWIDDH